MSSGQKSKIENLYAGINMLYNLQNCRPSKVGLCKFALKNECCVTAPQIGIFQKKKKFSAFQQNT